MKNELKEILVRYHGKKTSESGHEFYEEILALFHQLPDDIDGTGSVTPADFKYAKMQTVHQLLTESVDIRVHTPEDAEKLARVVDAAYGAIDSQSEAAKASPADDIDLNAADFSDALMWLKEGRKVARSGWNGKGMFLWHVPEGNYPARMEAIKGHFEGDQVPYGAYIAMKTSQGSVVPWLASQSDVLADDWVVVS